MSKNPFNPLFGRVPHIFIGRESIKHEFIQSLENRDDPWRSTIVTGMRGSGKTALLNSIKQDLPDNVISVSVSPVGELLNDILGQIYRQMPKSLTNAVQEISSVSVAGIGLGRNVSAPDFTQTFRYQLTSMLEKLQSKSIQVVFLIDEIQKHSEALRTFVATYQQIISENFDVALMVAGLPQAISDILTDKILTFFRRANQVQLQSVDIRLVEYDYKEVFDLPEEIVNQAAQATQGYPYLIQLIGYNLWETSKLDKAILESKSALFQNVHQIIFSELSLGDKEFIQAMARDERTSKVSDIGKRMGKDRNYISTYRLRLIDSGVIRAAGHGEVEFTLPYMREFLGGKSN